MLELVLELHVGISWRQACKNIKSVIQLVVGNAIQALGSVYVMLIWLFSIKYNIVHQLYFNKKLPLALELNG